LTSIRYVRDGHNAQQTWMQWTDSTEIRYYTTLLTGNHQCSI